MDADWIERAYQDTDDRNLDMEAARSAVSRLADMVDEFRKREATQDTIRERLRATVNAVQSLHDRLAQERPLGNAYVELLRDALRAPGGCDPWGVPCPTHGADHWRNATDRLTAERDAAVARAEAAEAAIQRVREVRPSHTGCLSWREVHQALDGEEGTA